ncbi:MAG: RT0821/Lpp0805 family surface protein [Magnetovibrionaceae bacterium]
MLTRTRTTLRRIGFSLVAAAMLAASLPMTAQAAPPWERVGYENHTHVHVYNDNRPDWKKAKKWKKWKKRQQRQARKQTVVHREVHKTVNHYYNTPAPHHQTGSNTATNTGGLLDISKQTGGTIIGAILGGAAGTQIGKGKGNTAAIVAGAVLGGVLGNQVGKSMDRNDLATFNNALETAPTGNPVSWTNPDSGVRYDVTPTRTWQNDAGAFCRDYSTWVFIDGYEEEVTGTACRDGNGTWVAQNY